MKFTLKFRTSDHIRNKLKQLGMGDRDRVEAVTYLKRWVRSGRQISVTFDSDSNTAEVLEARGPERDELESSTPPEVRLIQLPPEDFVQLKDWVEEGEVEYELNEELQAVVAKRR